MRHQNYKVSKAFPIEKRETIVIRDGQGRTVETWTAAEVIPYDHHKEVIFRQDGYKDVSHL